MPLCQWVAIQQSGRYAAGMNILWVTILAPNGYDSCTRQEWREMGYEKASARNPISFDVVSSYHHSR